MKVKVRVKSKKQEPEKVPITTEFIKLDAFLKFAVLVGSGGEAKAVIQDGLVSVNGEPCSERGKKLRPGDAVTFDGRTYIVSEGGEP